MVVIGNVSGGQLLGISTIETDPGLNHRERERKAVLQLLRKMLNDDEVIISHNADGKPTIPDWYISVSHTRGYAAVILSKTRPVGIDIEYLSDRVERIVQRFLRPDELATLQKHVAGEKEQGTREKEHGVTFNFHLSTFHILKAWCAKEAVYKYYSEDHLAYAEMRCTPVDSTHFIVENVKRNEIVRVAFQITDAYVVAWVE